MGRKRKNKVYFTMDTEQSIIDYNGTVDPIEKDKIYRKGIEVAMNKLVENVINRFKFPYFYESTENIQKEVISFIISIIHKFKNEKGKAFSYFSVVAKNYLILENRAKYEYQKSHKTIDVHEGSTFDITDPDDQYRIRQNEYSEFTGLMLEFWENNLLIIFKKQKDIKIADAVLELFRRAENIENFNKKALYVMIREMTGVRTQYITIVVNKMKSFMKNMLMEYQEYGIFDTNNVEMFED